MNIKAFAAHAVRAIPDFVGLVGIGLVVEGVREIYRPAAFIAAGLMLVVGAILHARGRAALAAASSGTPE